MTILTFSETAIRDYYNGLAKVVYKQVYFATCTDRVSRITVTFTCPG